MSVTSSQIILLAAVVFFVMYVFRFRTELRDRLIYLVIAGGGVLLIVAPQVASYLANLVGIGRGTDFLLYIFVMFTLFNTIAVSSHQRKVERQLTALVRRDAIAGATEGRASQ